MALQKKSKNTSRNTRLTACLKRWQKKVNTFSSKRWRSTIKAPCLCSFFWIQAKAARETRVTSITLTGRLDRSMHRWMHRSTDRLHPAETSLVDWRKHGRVLWFYDEHSDTTWCFVDLPFLKTTWYFLLFLALNNSIYWRLMQWHHIVT